MPTFPDQSAKEAVIATVGDAELLLKRGERIVRYQRGRWGTERERWRYKLLAPYASGRVLHAGLGMGISAEELLEAGVTELVCFEILADVAGLYEAQHDADARLIITVADAHASKPAGTFDLVLYELPLNTQTTYDQGKAYLAWAWQRVNPGGHVVIPHSPNAVDLVAEYPQLQPTIVSTQWMAPGVKASLRPLPIWIVVTK